MMETTKFSQHRWRAQATMLVMFLLFWTISTWNLDRFPSIHYDEPAILAPGYKLFWYGIYGSDMFTGFHGQENHYLEVPPLMSLLQGANARLLGVGIWQMRFVPVGLGLLTLSLVLGLARSVLSMTVAVMSGLLLLFWQWTPSGLDFLGSGIPLIDIARIARYDILVPPLGLGALWAWIHARRTLQLRYDFCSGLLAGLAGLANVYGLFWVVALLLLLTLDGLYFSGRPVQRSATLILLGVVATWLIWIGIIVAHWSDVRGQFTKHVGRFDLWDATFYLDSLRREIHRYHLGVHQPITFGRAGFWLLVIGMPIVVVRLGEKVIHQRNRQLLWLLVPSLVLPLLLALLVNTKRFYYLMTVTPLFAILLAWGLVQWFQSPGLYRRWIALGLVALVTLQGAFGMASMQSKARQTARPGEFFAQLRQIIPTTTGTIFGPPQYWLALPDRPYRSMALPFLLAIPLNLNPIPFDAAMDQIGPEIVLVNSSLERSFEPFPLFRDSFWRFMDRHQARVIFELRDYEGESVQIYQLDP